ncbi:MAG: ADP-ribosylation factor-like protein [Candidatus Hodarchaeales archaeon]|jgi:small GTP-binding protein
MSLEVLNSEDGRELLRELENYGLNRLESEILFLLLQSDYPLRTKDLLSNLNLAKHQIYNILNNLEKKNLLKQIGSKPKQYISDGTILKESLDIYEQEISVECNTLRNSTLVGTDKAYQILGFDEEAKTIHEYLEKKPATRNDLVTAFPGYSYEKIRNICEYLLYQKAISKTLRGKSLLYSGLTLGNVVDIQLNNLKNKVNDKKQRLDKILKVLEYPEERESETASVFATKTLTTYEKISPLLLTHSEDSTEILSSLFVLIDNNFTKWTDLMVTEIRKSIKLCFSGIKVKWLVDRTFLDLFKKIETDLKEQTINAFPRLSIRVVSRYSTRIYIIDEEEFFEFPQATQFLDKTLYIKDKSATKVKRLDFLDIWDQSHDFLPLFNDSIAEDELIYFIDHKEKLTRLKSFNIAFLGNKGVGKTSIVKRYLTDRWDPQIKVTLGILVDESYIKVPKSIRDEYEEIKLVIYDYGGQELFRDLYTGQLTGKHGIALIFSVNDRQSFEDLEYWITLIPKSEFKNHKVILIGSKRDLQGEINQDKIWDFRKKYNIEHYFETSALLGENIKKVFQEFAEILYDLKI